MGYTSKLENSIPVFQHIFEGFKFSVNIILVEGSLMATKTTKKTIFLISVVIFIICISQVNTSSSQGQETSDWPRYLNSSCSYLHENGEWVIKWHIELIIIGPLISDTPQAYTVYAGYWDETTLGGNFGLYNPYGTGWTFTLSNGSEIIDQVVSGNWTAYNNYPPDEATDYYRFFAETTLNLKKGDWVNLDFVNSPTVQYSKQKCADGDLVWEISTTHIDVGMYFHHKMDDFTALTANTIRPYIADAYEGNCPEIPGFPLYILIGIAGITTLGIFAKIRKNLKQT